MARCSTWGKEAGRRMRWLELDSEWPIWRRCSGICAGLHRPNAASIADKMLFMVAALAAEMERDLIRERTLDGLAAAHAVTRPGCG